MRIALFCIISGMLLVQCLSTLPQPIWLVVLLSSTLAWRDLRPLLWFVLGFCWAAWRADYALANRLAPTTDDHAQFIIGYVADFPSTSGEATQFLFIAAPNSRLAPWPRRPARVYLRWYGAPFLLEPGSDCELAVRLKRPRGVRNAYGFDAEQWQYATNVTATGYVIAHSRNHCQVARDRRVARLRSTVVGAIAQAVGDPATASVLSALAVGARADIADAQWRLLRDTGTVHLISVSGLHVAMVAAAAYAFSHPWLLMLLPRVRHRRAMAGASLVALAAAIAYSVVTGFTVPTQRTVIMIAITLSNKLRDQRLFTLDSWLLAATLVLFLSPAASLTLSFWLSFGTIALLGVLSARRLRSSRSTRWFGIHVLLAFLMAPLLGFAFQLISIASPLANAVVIPGVTAVVVPLLLMGMLLLPVASGFSALCFAVAASVWQILARYLAFIDGLLPPLNLPFQPSVIALALATTAALIALIPLRSSRLLLVPALLYTLYLPRIRPPLIGDYRVEILDVGQGLSVIVATATHVMVFDAGPKFRSGADAGKAIVAPYLNALGLRRIDRLVISHSDSDHAGGAATLLAQQEVGELLGNPGPALAARAAPCRGGQQWSWDGVQFTILHPAEGLSLSDNNGSCVIRIDGRGGALLLTGDIEALAEQALIARGANLHADILVVPHHGSKTSSTAPFIAAVAPKFAVFSVGFGNRFHQPAPSVVAAYEARGVTCMTTADEGAISFEVTPTMPAPRRERAARRRYWDP
ncbi:MAG: DNA internalization-related competence protein ComEC/Rec2 [Gammaproteobacteria bacterium]|nr:DNA internalization-related competence protein ComEC/Rec2 [Gammaproteobacteria bacterium]